MLTLLLLLAVPPAEIRYLALGDSFTIGTGTSEQDAFPHRLKVLLERKKKTRVELLNPAVNGYSTQELIDVELPLMANFQPTLITLAIGANDIARNRSAPDYRANLKKIFAALPAKIVIAIPQPDWSRSPVAKSFGDPAQLQTKIMLYNTILAEEAKAAGAKYVDLWPLMRKQADAKKLADDGLHPSANAQLEWAEALVKAL